MKDLKIGNEFIYVNKVKQQYPHLVSVKLTKLSYANVELILGQDAFLLKQSRKCFETDFPDIPVTVRPPLGWVLSWPLLLT